jgi:hypothetical protein
MLKSRVVLLIFSVVSLVSACGGGGSSTTSSTTAPNASSSGNTSPSNTVPVNMTPSNTNADTTNPSTNNPPVTPVGSLGLKGTFNARVLEKAGNEFVALSGLGLKSVSADGSNWADVGGSIVALPSGSFVNGGTYLSQNSTYYIFSGNGNAASQSGDGVFKSSDALSWTPVNTGVVRATGLVYGGGAYVVVGQSGNGATSTIARSVDGSVWTAPTSGSTVSWSGVAVDGSGRFVAVGPGGITAKSVDGGAVWTINAAIAGAPPLQSVAYASFANLFVAVGNLGKIFTSTDGVAWSPVPSAGFNIETAGNLLRVSCSSTGCAGTAGPPTGDGIAAVFGTTDLSARQWRVSTYGTSPGAKIHYGVVAKGSGWISVGDQGSLVTSTDGLFWNLVPSR